MTPLVSCLVPAYDAERYLAEALDSVLAQTHRPIEIIVLDDGSTDRTAEVARRHHPDVHVVTQDHGGLISARDAGVDASTGEFVAFLDADDRWVDTKLERQLAVFRRHPDTDLCVAQYRNFWEDPAAARAYADHPLAQPQGGYVVPTLMARRTLFDDVGGFAASRPSDTGWFAGAVEQGCSVHRIPEVLLHRRVHSSNKSVVSSSRSLDGLFDLIAVRRESARRIED